MTSSAGDLGVRPAPRHQREHLGLARRELLQARVASRVGRGLPRHALDHAAGDRGRQQRVAGGDRVDRRDQLLRPRALQQEARGAGAERAEDVVVLLEGGEDHDLHLGEGGRELAGGGDAVEVGHAHVHQHHVGPQQPGPVGGLAAVVRLADELDRVVAREHAAQAGAHEVVVVDDQDPDARLRQAVSSGMGRRARTSKRPSRAPPPGCRPAARRARACRPGRGRRPRSEPAARGDRFSTAHAELALAEVDLDPGVAVPVARGVGERLLDDPVGAAVDAGGSGRRSPWIELVTSRPAARCRSTRPSREASPGGRLHLARARGVLAQDPDHLVDVADGLARDLLDGRERLARFLGIALGWSRPMPAWTRITLIACPAESCRSRAMRPRSSAAARRRSRSASRSARSARSSSSAMRSRRSRVRSPASHAPPQTVMPNRISAPEGSAARRRHVHGEHRGHHAQGQPRALARPVAGERQQVDGDGRPDRRPARLGDRRRAAAGQRR